jgi:chromosome segregation ATPase
MQNSLKSKELKRQIEPRQNEITDMKRQIKEMDLELQQYHFSNAALDLMIGELGLKIEGMQKEISVQDKEINTNSGVLEMFKECLIYIATQTDNHKAVKNKVIQMYKRFVTKAEGRALETDTDAKSESLRMREFLEKSVESIKKKIEKDMSSFTVEATR